MWGACQALSGFIPCDVLDDICLLDCLHVIVFENS